MSRAPYVHAFGAAILTRFYDPMMRWMREDEFKGRLVELAQIEAGQRVLDVGCGTGTLALLIERRHPGAEVHGSDGDPKVLEIARGKATQAGARVKLQQAMAWEMPYPDGTFDRVVSSLMIHHLAAGDKLRAAREFFRVLRPGGMLIVADFGPPHSRRDHAVTWLLRRFEHVRDNLSGRLPAMFEEAGFEGVTEIDRFPTFLTPIMYLRGHKPQART